MTVLTLSVGAELADVAAALLHQLGASGLELRDGETLPPPGVAPLGAGRAELRGYFDQALAAEAAAAHLKAVLGVQADLEELPPEDWTVSWRASFRPVLRGRILVVAPWMNEQAAPTPHGGIRVVVEPGLAFGTGDHPTTGMCLEELDLWLQSHPGGSVLDVGTGSGLLAIAARGLGAGATCAVDNDPVAVRVARENAAANRVVLDVRADLPSGATFELVLANILANTLVELAPALSAAVAPGGRLVLSGILEGQASEVEAAYRPWLRPRSRAQELEWTCLVLEKRG